MARPLRMKPTEWAEIKEMYISGQFRSIKELHEHLVKTLPKDKCPSYLYLSLKSRNAGWTIDRQYIAQKKEQSTAELFAKNGMPKEEAVKVCIEGMSAGRSMLVELEEKLRAEENMPAADIINFVQKLNTNMAIVRGFLQEYNKMTGNYAPQQVESSVTVEQDEEYHRAYEERLKKIEK